MLLCLAAYHFFPFNGVLINLISKKERQRKKEERERKEREREKKKEEEREREGGRAHQPTSYMDTQQQLPSSNLECPSKTSVLNRVGHYWELVQSLGALRPSERL
jgi:septal ring factor EnvC (AmiA/AmiB activator)